MKVYEKTCHVCGKTYETTHRSQLYCDECKRLGRHPPKKCRICGRPFLPVNKNKGHGAPTTCCDDCAARLAQGEKARNIQREATYRRIDAMTQAARNAGVSYGVWSAMCRMKLYAN